MKLWTHHPSSFRLDTAVEIDYTRGQYWSLDMPDIRYREVLPKLHELIGTDQFLWCCTVRGEFIRTTEEIDVIEWELDIPESGMLRWYDVHIWEDIVSGRGQEWGKLFVEVGEINYAGTVSKDIGALVKFPVPLNWVTCLGPLPVMYPRSSRLTNRRNRKPVE